MPASVSRATIHAGVGRVGSTSRTMRVAKTDAPTRPRIGRVVDGSRRERPSVRDIRRRRLLDRVAEARTGGVRVLARDAADRERVAAVGRDVDLDGDVVEAEQRDRVGADGRVDAERRRGAGCRRARRRDRAPAPRRSCRRRRGRRSCAPRSGTGRAARRPAASRRPCRRRRSCGRRRRCRARPGRRRPRARRRARRAPGTSGWSCRWTAAPRRTRAPRRRRSGPGARSGGRPPLRTRPHERGEHVLGRRPRESRRTPRASESGTRIRPPFRTAR